MFLVQRFNYLHFSINKTSVVILIYVFCRNSLLYENIFFCISFVFRITAMFFVANIWSIKNKCFLHLTQFAWLNLTLSNCIEISYLKYVVWCLGLLIPTDSVLFSSGVLYHTFNASLYLVIIHVPLSLTIWLMISLCTLNGEYLCCYMMVLMLHRHRLSCFGLLCCLSTR